MKVREIMSRPAVACTLESTLGAAARIMRDTNCGALPVLDAHGRVAGIITDRDICLALANQSRNCGDLAVERAMSGGLVTVQTTDALHRALAVMQQAHIRRVPVLDMLGHLQGMLSIEDLLVRGLESGGLGVDDIVMAMRAIFERRPAPLGYGTAAAI